MRKSIAKAEEKKAEAEVEMKKSEAKVKERDERVKAREKKKSSEASKKDKKDEHDIGVAKCHDHVRHGKVFTYGGGSPRSAGPGVSYQQDLSDTDVPDDDDFLVEWDEWSEIEKGKGPMASWHDLSLIHI